MKGVRAHSLFWATVVVTCGVVFNSFALETSPQNRAATSASARPRLVVLIVIDQFRYDFLSRFGDLFSARGIGRLMREGASWSDANFDHTPTLTAPGHATLMTGAWPSETGIIGNDWFDLNLSKKVSS